MGSNEVPSSLHRRNSIPSAMVPTKLDIPIKLQSSSFPITNGDRVSSLSAVDFELISLKSSQEYTSLKDLIPSSSPTTAVQSPTASGIQSCYEISIRNRLVKQAAWAYLQPMSSSPNSSGNSFRRMWVRFSSECIRNPVNACLRFINRRIIPTISQALNRILGAIWVWKRNRGQQ
ncbi:hypothetical protein BVC80_1289g28 [Macleaya cordata]|uniref:Uncharacterized protein n=1 Tax=Macleaya cordata TaxID=56857 RepID=A0A200Q9H3_MACCD|nr:hypothetical protein BVC80_1289g28 [Macleaya cordata]